MKKLYLLGFISISILAFNSYANKAREELLEYLNEEAKKDFWRDQSKLSRWFSHYRCPCHSRLQSAIEEVDLEYVTNNAERVLLNDHGRDVTPHFEVVAVITKFNACDKHDLKKECADATEILRLITEIKRKREQKSN